MAQHIPVEKIRDKTVDRIVDTIRNMRYFDTSFRYFSIPHEDFKETPTDKVYGCSRTVPNSIVYGGKALFEIHTEPVNGGSTRRATNIYLVA